MTWFGVALFLLGAFVGFVCSLWLLGLGFQEGPGWGLSVLLAPFAANIIAMTVGSHLVALALGLALLGFYIAFIIMCWESTRTPFFTLIAAAFVQFLGVMTVASTLSTGQRENFLAKLQEKGISGLSEEDIFGNASRNADGGATGELEPTGLVAFEEDKERRVAALNAEIAKAQFDLQREAASQAAAYETLNRERESMDRNDAQAVERHNQKIREYAELQSRLIAHKALHQQLIERRQRILDLQPPEDIRVTAPNRTSPASQNTAKVVIYSASWCGPCKQAKAYLTQRKIPFVDYDVEKDARAGEEFRRLGGGGVPLIVIGDQVIRGFSPSAIDNALSRR